jgi:TolB-like protein/cytochrome c-type biogenesis protein CcmH/NrfG
MSSIIKDYEYDIFISYRQNDNKYDKWVTEFVSNLKKELEATIKEKISIYLDENPDDGLLETHNVDKSLLNKLKSLIFIPVLSQTYCDPYSYAWQHEFLAFNKMSREDEFTKDIRLRTGNITGRILPIKIHDLDPDDLQLLQDELGTQIRAIDFIYKEPGVNRPLRPDDNEDKNLNKTRYRNQVNKVANSIKEILISIRNPGKMTMQISGDIPAINPSAKSIAVLPFVNMSNDPEQEYFSDGISEEIINTLVQIPGLKVTGRTSAFSFKNKNEDLRSIGEKLNVNTILEGSVRKSGNRIRVTVQLIEASTGFHLWSQKFDRELNDVFIIQDEIAKTIVDKLQVTLEGQTEPKERVHTQNIDAYQLYLKGMSLLYKRGLHMFEALQCFKDALKIDPDYALALSGLADSYTMLSLHSYMAPEEAWPKAEEAANRALHLETELAEVHASIATIAMLFERDWIKAEKEYQTALQINPRYLQARSWYSVFYLQIYKRDFEEGVRQARLGAENDPLSAYAQTILSNLAVLAGYPEEALTAGLRGVEFDPESFSAWYFLGYVQHYSRNFPDAIKSYRKAIDISGRHSWALVSLMALLIEPSPFQQVEEANYIYRELLTKEKVGYVSPFVLALASASLGKNEEAIRYVKLGVERHDPYIIISVPGRPDNKNLMEIPEFVKIMKTIGL